MRVIRWMLKPEQKSRPNVEDLLNLPNVSIRLRERALKRNIQHMQKKQNEIATRRLDRTPSVSRYGHAKLGWLCIASHAFRPSGSPPP